MHPLATEVAHTAIAYVLEDPYDKVTFPNVNISQTFQVRTGK